MVAKRVLQLTSFVACYALLTASQAAEPLSLTETFGAAGVNNAAISPDGRHVAAVISASFGNQVVVIKTDDLSSRTVIESKWVQDGFYKIKKDPSRVKWITSEWLSVDYPYSSEAVDLNGKRVAELGNRAIGRVAWAAPDAPLMLVYNDEDYESLALVNVKTREKTSVKYPMSGRLVDWAFDDKANLRAATMASTAFWDDKTTLTYWYKPLDTQAWQKIDETSLTDEHWTLLQASSRADELVVMSSEGRDTAGVFSYAPLKHQLGELLAGHPKEDIRVADDVTAEQYESVVTFGMKPVRYWFDSRMAGLQTAVDQALPQRLNHITGDPKGLMLIFSYGDVDPGRWYLLNAADMTMRLILVARSRVDPTQMRPMEIVSYPAPDGLVIPAYLTRPIGDGPKPTVVMVHGGPAVRDEWGWDPEVQLLAARGYAVFQPQFRGSSGFGKTFQRAGYGQWGLSMQDDITAGVEYLIKQGVADPKRICIYGASYGGYAAVWGLTKTPDLYRCGITLAGVSDIEYMLSDWSDTNSNKSAREWQRFVVGDRKRDKVKFDQVSPLKHAQDIRAPLLIAHGDDDKRVPISHAKKLMKALDAQHKPYEWVLLPDEGHGIYYLRSRLKFSNALLEFLDKHIGSGTSPGSAKP